MVNDHYRRHCKERAEVLGIWKQRSISTGQQQRSLEQKRKDNPDYDVLTANLYLRENPISANYYCRERTEFELLKPIDICDITMQAGLDYQCFHIYKKYDQQYDLYASWSTSWTMTIQKMVYGKMFGASSKVIRFKV